MLSYLVLLPALAAAAWAVGVQFPAVRALPSLADRAFAAVWAGLVVLAAGLTTFAFVLPLRPALVLPAVGLGAVAAALREPARAELRRLRSAVGGPALTAAGLLLVAGAVLAAGRWPAYDVGLYHYPAMQWLEAHGAVPGLALLHARFGTLSEWWALLAPLDAGPVEGRVDALGGVLVALLLAGHGLVAARRILLRRADAADWFLALAVLALFPLFARPAVTSTYAEVPAAGLTVLAAWIMVARADPERPTPGEPPGGDPALLAVLFGAGAAAMKLSALPVLAVALAFHLSSAGRATARRLARSAGVALAVVGPLVALSVLTSGCPLFPSAAGCLELPWTAPGLAEETREVIRSWARWTGPAPEGAAAGFWTVDWVGHWIAEHPIWTALLAAAVSGSLWRLVRTRVAWQRDGRFWAALLSVAGVALVVAAAPDPRFLRAYVAVGLALAAGPPLRAAWRRVAGRLRPGPGGRDPAPWLAAAAALALLLGQPAYYAATRGPARFLRRAASVRLLAPERLPTDPGLERRSGANFRYLVPAEGDRCWAAPLPCTPGLPRGDIRLRDPGDGFGSGFRLPR